VSRLWSMTGWALTLVAAWLFPAVAKAQTASLAERSDWYVGEVTWHSSRGLPASTEFIAPLRASYNWAYGATVLGLNVRVWQGTDCYAAVAWLKDGLLECIGSEGPLSDPAQWDCGPYHAAAALPDGRLVVWLMAPGEYPHAFLFSTSLEPGSAIDCEVYPPDPPSADWAAWRVVAAFQLSNPDPVLIVETQDGNGLSYGYYNALRLPGDLRSLSYTGYPTAHGAIPTVLYTAAYKVTGTTRSYTVLRTSSAWFDTVGRRWYATTLDSSGLNSPATGFSSGSDVYGMFGPFTAQQDANPYLRLVTYSLTTAGASQPQLGRSCQLPGAGEMNSLCLLDSARSSLPLACFSDGKDIWLGWYRRDAAQGVELPYDFLKLQEGEQRSVDGEWLTAYPVEALAGAAHWNTGNPELFWIQQGTWVKNEGTLFRLGFEPQQR
jgi:hypothetical protein